MWVKMWMYKYGIFLTQEHGGRLYWALGDHKFLRASGWMGGLVK